MDLFKFVKKSKMKSIDSGLVLVSIFAFVVFIFCIFRLHGSIIPSCDEGLFAEAGVLMFKGYIPYLDFPLPHLPMLAILIGIPLKLTGSMYWVHLLYLFTHFLSSIVLYKNFQFFYKNKLAGIVAVTLYLTCSGALLDTTRCVSMRTVSNIFLIGFIFVGIHMKQSLNKSIILFSIASVSIFTFEPTLLILIGVSLLLLLRTPKELRTQVAEHHLIIYLILIVIIGALLLHPKVYQQLIEAWADRERISFFTRINVLRKGSNIFFYFAGIFGFFIEIFKGTQMKKEAVGGLFLIIISALLPPSFYPHYIGAASPAFALGIFLLLVQMDAIQTTRTSFLPSLSIIIAVMLLTAHGLSAWPSLFHRWFQKRNDSSMVIEKDFFEMIDVLKRSPEPLLTLSPIYAAESGMNITKKPMNMFFRMPTYKHLTENEFQNLDAEACTIHLYKRIRNNLTSKTLERYFRDYEIAWRSPSGSPDDVIIFWTHHAFCKAPNYGSTVITP